MKATKPERHQRATNAQLAALDEFIELQLAGRSPSTEEFLKHHPRIADAIRPMLEGADVMYREVERFRKSYPGVNLARLGLPPRKR